jgi:superfamily I DNA and RNA helicase
LPVCYRNTPWALSTAHALGFGIYREGGLVQMFDEAPLWRDIGYETKSGHLTPGNQVRLARRADCSPTFFSSLLKADDAIQFIPFPDEAEQAAWIAQSIHVDIVEQELEPRDILIIIPDAWTARPKAATLMKALDALGHGSHLAGVTSSRDLIFVDNSIAITGIYRAKGNEAPMVYVANAEYCFSGAELSKKRNTLFTAITRSRAWVRVCGVGSKMELLMQEAQRVGEHNFELEFRYPTIQEIKRMKRIHRDLLADEHKNMEGMKRILQQIAAGELSIESLPTEIRDLMRTVQLED